MDMEDIISRVSEYTGVPVEELKLSRGSRSVSEARQIVMYVSRRLYGKTVFEISSCLNCTHQNVSSRILDFEQSMKIHKGLKERVCDIKEWILPRR
jgi:chromosomal replication initiation ATPase DnaA